MPTVIIDEGQRRLRVRGPPRAILWGEPGAKSNGAIWLPLIRQLRGASSQLAQTRVN